MKKVFVFLAEGFEEIEAISIIDVLRRGEINAVTVSITGKNEVRGAHNIPVIADVLFEDVNLSDGEMLILPGGGPGSQNLNAHEGVKSMILEFNRKGKKLAAICAAPLVFGGLGILEGRNATCYPGCESTLTGAIVKTDAVVKDGNIITGRGPGFAVDFALAVLSELQGKLKADEVAGGLLVK